MNIEGKKVKINKSAVELYNFLTEPKNFKALMPENVETFEANEDGFVFALKGMPKVALKLGSSNPNNMVEYVSAKESLQFSLDLQIAEESDSESTLQILFNGKFNPFIRTMVEKPLTNFISSLEQNAEKL